MRAEAIFYRLRDIIVYFPKVRGFVTVTTPLLGTVGLLLWSTCTPNVETTVEWEQRAARCSHFGVHVDHRAVADSAQVLL